MAKVGNDTGRLQARHVLSVSGRGMSRRALRCGQIIIFVRQRVNMTAI
jgi:hypothetical protein